MPKIQNRQNLSCALKLNMFSHIHNLRLHNTVLAILVVKKKLVLKAYLASSTQKRLMVLLNVTHLVLWRCTLKCMHLYRMCTLRDVYTGISLTKYVPNISR